MKCKELVEKFEDLAPKSLAQQWDNVGLLVGDSEQEIKKVLVALDATEEVIQEAKALGADAIVTHHPLLFSAIKKITTKTPTGNKIIELVKNNICHIALHTNLDIATGGTNDKLSQIIGLTNIQPLNESALGRIGELETEITLEEFAKNFKGKLEMDTIRVVGELNKPIKKIGLCTGSGVDFMADAKEKGADLYITGDLRYHESQKALDMGIALIDATHYASENIIVPTIGNFIESNTDLQVVLSQVDGQVFKNL
ncbi:MAG: Nif3-like dinuclear metal center hexameric protein [Anaerotignaceae bacterium]